MLRVFRTNQPLLHFSTFFDCPVVALLLRFLISSGDRTDMLIDQIRTFSFLKRCLKRQYRQRWTSFLQRMRSNRSLLPQISPISFPFTSFHFKSLVWRHRNKNKTEFKIVLQNRMQTHALVRSFLLFFFCFFFLLIFFFFFFFISISLFRSALIVAADFSLAMHMPVYKFEEMTEKGHLTFFLRKLHGFSDSNTKLGSVRNFFFFFLKHLQEQPPSASLLASTVRLKRLYSSISLRKTERLRKGSKSLVQTFYHFTELDCPSKHAGKVYFYLPFASSFTIHWKNVHPQERLTDSVLLYLWKNHY